MATLVIVTPDRRKEMLRDTSQIWLTDYHTVQQPTAEEMGHLVAFLNDDYVGAPARCYWPPTAMHVAAPSKTIDNRGQNADIFDCTVFNTGSASFAQTLKVGYDDVGVYMNVNHTRRYAAVASTAVGVGAPPPPAHPDVAQDDSVAASLKFDLRQKLMQDTFKVADKNMDGQVSKAELRLLLRRVVPYMKTQDVDAMFSEMDKDCSGFISMGEFANWMQSSAADALQSGLERAVMNHKNFIHASFRLWDLNGDGSISKAELIETLRHVHPNIEDAQLKALFATLDHDKSEHVDYHEFVNFLWGA